MAIFTIQAPDGRKLRIEAADEATAMQGAQEYVAANPRQEPAAPPASTTPPPGVPVPFGGQIAFADQAIEGVPVAGPFLKEQAQNLRSGIAQGIEALPDWVPLVGGYKAPAKEAIDQYSQAAVQQNPVEATAGTAFGTVAPLAGAGLVPGVSRALGMSGGLASQIGFGVPTGMALNAADTAARGGDPGEVGNAALIGGGVAAALPIGGSILSRILGRTVPRDARNLGRALKDDNIDPTTINQQLQDMGEGSMVMDLGPNLQAQAGALASVPGQAQKTVRAAVQARAKDASKRVAGDLAATVGTGPEIGQMTEQIIAQQDAAATPLYKAVRNVPVKPSGNILFVMQTPTGKAAFQEALKMAADRGMPIPDGQLTVGLIDLAKRALDDIAGEALRVGKRNKGGSAAELATILVNETDKIAPGYAAARAAFAGPAKVIEAIELGQTILTKDISPGQLQSKLASMTPSEIDGTLQAFRASLEAQLGNAVNDALSLRNTLKKGWNEEKLRILLGDDVTDEIMKRVSREAAFGETSGVVARNSETARRLASQEEVAPDLKRLEPAGALALLFRAINDARARLMGNVYAKSNQKLAQSLASGQLPPKALAQAKRAMQPKGRAPLPAAALPMVPGNNGRQPIDITIYGGAA